MPTLLDLCHIHSPCFWRSHAIFRVHRGRLGCVKTCATSGVIRSVCTTSLQSIAAVQMSLNRKHGAVAISLSLESRTDNGVGGLCLRTCRGQNWDGWRRPSSAPSHVRRGSVSWLSSESLRRCEISRGASKGDTLLASARGDVVCSPSSRRFLE